MLRAGLEPAVFELEHDAAHRVEVLAVARDVLRRAAVFVGGFDLASFAGVFGTDDDTSVLRALDRLVRSSLVVAEHVDGRVRYRLLETIRQFGIDELAVADLLDSSRDLHARWFANAVVAKWAISNGPGWGNAVDWLRTELADLRAAFRWAEDRDLSTAVDIAAHAALIGTEANLFEPITWAESVVDAATVADLPRLPRLLCACGFACFVGRPATAATHAEHAMRLEADPRYESCEPGLSAFIAALANDYAGRLDRYVELATIADGFGCAALAFARPALASDTRPDAGQRAPPSGQQRDGWNAALRRFRRPLLAAEHDGSAAPSRCCRSDSRGRVRDRRTGRRRRLLRRLGSAVGQRCVGEGHRRLRNG